MSESLQNVQQLTGEALAAAVAERVMGWSRVPHSERWFNDDDTGPWVRDFRPDLNIAQAIEIVQRMIELNWDFSLEWEPTHGERPIAGFYRHAVKDADDAVFVAADTIPEAICRAALAAVETARV